MGLYQLSDNFQPVGRLWLRLVSEPHVVGRLETGPRVVVGVFSVGGVVSRGSCLQGAYLLEPLQIVDVTKCSIPPAVILCPRSSICIMNLPALQTIPFLHGDGFVHVDTGMDSSALTACWPTGVVAVCQVGVLTQGFGVKGQT